jgi:hypothetical protein
MYPILVSYIKKWPLTEEVGWWVDLTATIERNIGPWFKSPKPLYNFCLANLAHFHVAAILAISTYIKPNIFQNGDI